MGHLKADPGCVDAAICALSPHDPAAMFSTSGTTGRPKGVVLTHFALIDRASAIDRLERLTDHDGVLAYLPPAWIRQNIVSYTPFLVTVYTLNKPTSTATHNIDKREISYT